jgi:anti-sigma factor RsiW
MEALISPYLDRDLSPAERKAVEAHLQDCPECRELLALLREVSTSLQAFPEVEISPDLYRRLLAIPERKRRYKESLVVTIQDKNPLRKEEE